MIKVRKAVLEDVNGIVFLWGGLFDYHKKHVVKNKKLRPYLEKNQNAALVFKKFLKKAVKSKEFTVHVAEIDGKLVGYSLCHLKSGPPVFKIKKFGYISDMYVDEKFRGKGISSLLLSESIKWFRKKGLKYMSLDVDANNAKVHKIYKKWGFVDYHIQMRRKI